MNSTNTNPIQEVFVSIAVLDSKMQTLQTKLASIKKANLNLAKIIHDEENTVEKMEKEINDFSVRELKIQANIDNRRHTKKFLQEMETNLKHQLVIFKDKNEANKVAQKNLIIYYSKIADEYHEIYNSLPLAKERNLLRIENLKKCIQINLLKKEYNDYIKKTNLFKSISDLRIRVTIIAFVQVLTEREKKKKKTKNNLEYQKKLLQEIAELEEKKKILNEKLSNKAKDAVAKIMERNVSNQSRFSGNKVSINIKPVSSAISIKERLGLNRSIPFYKLVPLNIPSKTTTSVSQVINAAELSSTIHFDHKTISSNISQDINQDLQISNEEQLSSMHQETEQNVQKVSEILTNKSVKNEELLVEPVQQISKTIEKPRKEALINLETKRKQSLKKGIKRSDLPLNKNDHKVKKKIRRVSFKSVNDDNTCNAQNKEKNTNREVPVQTKNIVCQLSTPFIEPSYIETDIKVISDSRSIPCDNQSEEMEQISSEDTSLILSESIIGNYDRGLSESPTFIADQDDNEREEVTTPQIHSYFSSPTYNVDKERTHHQSFQDRPISSSHSEEDKEIYNFPMTSVNAPPNPLSTPFSKNITAPTGNKGLESFFGTPSSDGDKKTKNFFDLF